MDKQKIIRYGLIAISSAVLTVAVMTTVQNFKPSDSNMEASPSSTTSVAASSATSQAEKQPEIANTSSQADTQESQCELIHNTIQDFFTAYYHIDTSDDQINYSLEHFESYKGYFTEGFRRVMQPSEATSERNYAPHVSYTSELHDSKIYLDEIENKCVRALAFVLVATHVGDSNETPKGVTALINLELRQQPDGSWLINDIIMNKQMNIELPTEELF